MVFCSGSPRFENKFEVFYDGSQQFTNQEVPSPPRYLQDRYMHSILVYAAYFKTLDEVAVGRRRRRRRRRRA